MNNIQITRNAIEYLEDVCGLDNEEAEEHLTIAIGMCRISSKPEVSVEQKQQRIAKLEAFAEKFLENFNTCQYCDGKGINQYTGYTCEKCEGVGILIASIGVLKVDLYQEAEDLLEGVRS